MPNTAKVGYWIVDRQTKSVYKITAKSAARITYSGIDGDGEIAIDALGDHFIVLNDPTAKDDIESLLSAMIASGEAEKGLYDMGIGFLVAGDGPNGTIGYQWFPHAESFRELIRR